MDISRKADYALRLLTDLILEPSGILSVRIAAENNNVPYSFARAIQHDLTSANILENIRGAHGGMHLAVDPHEVSLLEIVEAVQGPLLVATCDTAGPDGGECPRLARCRFNPVWNGIHAVVRDYLSSVSLYDIVHGYACPQIDPHFCEKDAFAPEKMRGSCKAFVKSK